MTSATGQADVVVAQFAVASGDHAAAVDVLERHASLNYANFDSIESISIDWQ
ncbi:hypothetical protein ACIBM3_31030 [Rhodococcus erythropolis]|uniref:hypothetical protein n=1 Tax=Rhodococcus erythropolis TaxID=1833 RepID=UPI0037A6AD86